MSGCSALSFSSSARTPLATSSSPAPRLRVISKPTTGLPSSSAAERCSPTVSVTDASCSSRTRRPSVSTMSMRASSAADWTVPIVRTDCSTPPTSARPPEASCCVWRNWREMSAAVAPSESMRIASSSTRTSRSTPPTRATAPTPRTLRQPLRHRVVDEPRQRLVVHPGRGHRVGEDRRAGEVDLAHHTGRAGLPGSDERIRDTASRTPSTASCVGTSSRNSTVTVTEPDCTSV